MLVINDVVNKKGTDHPTGTIEDIISGVARVRWGVQDKHKFTEDVPLDQLVLYPHKIISPVEVQRRQAKETGLPFRETAE